VDSLRIVCGNVISIIMSQHHTIYADDKHTTIPLSFKEGYIAERSFIVKVNYRETLFPQLIPELLVTVGRQELFPG